MTYRLILGFLYGFFAGVLRAFMRSMQRSDNAFAIGIYEVNSDNRY
jgi:hypothetical protein